jgi:hypothetical protein
MVLIVIIGTGGALMTFPNVRQVGATCSRRPAWPASSPVSPRGRCSAI